METIRLNAVHKSGRCIKYDFTVTQGLGCYFSGKPFEIYYQEDMTCVPDGVAVIPFVCNVLPIIWLTDSVLKLPELDKSFYECIPEVKKGYETMFPESNFAGRIEAEHILACDRPSEGRCAAFFSGGLDATQTLISHFEEKPDLISIWGADIKFGNEEGWNNVHNGIKRTCERFRLRDVVIRSSFREFDNEGELDARFGKQLQDGWWHGVKHGIALLGHAAPYAYLNGLKRVYIGSSHCPADGKVRCASNPTIDNFVRFADCRVVHDGFEFNRQDKMHNIVQYAAETGIRIDLHVCWMSQSGSNCCRCEKCYRTMASLMAEGVSPLDYGFEYFPQTIADMQRYIVDGKALNQNLAKSCWKHIHDKACENIALLKSKNYWKYMKWIAKADFLDYENINMPLYYRIRKRLALSRIGALIRKVRGRR